MSQKKRGGHATLGRLLSAFGSKSSAACELDNMAKTSEESGMTSQLMKELSSPAMDVEADQVDYIHGETAHQLHVDHQACWGSSSGPMRHFGDLTEDEKRRSVAIGMVSLKIGKKEKYLECDRDEPISQEKSCLGKLLDILEVLIQPSLHFRLSSKVFRSHDTIVKEQERQHVVNRYIIHPLSPFRASWDLIMVVMLSITLVILPVEIAFYTDDLTSSKWQALNLLVDTVFFLDIFINFRTAYIHSATEEVILNNRSIIWHYLRTWFLLDLVSTVPFDYLFLGIHEGRNGSNTMLVGRTLRILRLTKLLSLLKIFRIARLVRYVHKVEEMLKSEARIIGIANLLLVTMVFVHWNACCQFLVAFLSDFPQSSWVSAVGLANSTIWNKYSYSVFRAMSHMVSVGYGQHPPQNTTEVWMTTLSTMLGASFYAIFVAHMSSIIITSDSSGKAYQERITQVKDYMRFRRVPLELQSRVMDYYEHRYQRKFFDEWSILHEQYMSYPLKRDILMHNCRSLVEKVPFFFTAPIEFLVEIITKLQFQVFFPGDIIIQAGRRGESMFFIEHGRVEIRLPSGKVVNFLADGTHFGEIALVMEERRVATVIAVEISDIYCLSKKDFNSVLRDFPEMRKRMEDSAKERLQSIRHVKIKPAVEIDVQEANAVEVELQSHMNESY